VPFSKTEQDTLLAVKGIGPTVVRRLEEIGLISLEQLSKAEMLDVVAHGATMMSTSCWKNSPQLRAVLSGAINAAQNAASGNTEIES
jgi:spore coat protein CotF